MDSNDAEFSLFFKTLAPTSNLTTAQKNKLQSSMKVLEVKEKTHLFKPGNSCKEIYFIAEGMFMSYELLNGKESPICIFQANDFITDLPSLWMPAAARVGLLCLKKAVLISVSINTWKQLCDEDPYFCTLYLNTTLRLFSNQIKAATLLKRGNTEERLQQLNSIYPGILNMVSQKSLAMMFGVTDQAISRAITNLT